MQLFPASLLCLFFYRTCTGSVVSKVNDVTNHLGTRTPYRLRCNNDDSRITFPNCTDIKIWMLIRHGTRLPSPKDVQGMTSTLDDLKQQILKVHHEGNGELTKLQLEHLKKWSANIDVKNSKDLTQEGGDEMVLLAERMAKRFPNAIKSKYSKESFYIRYTPTQRAKQSAHYFTLGLFDKKNSQKVVYAPALKQDLLIRFYKYCDNWQKQVKKNPVTYEEQKIFGKSQVMRETRQLVSKKLGLSEVISLDDVNLMYKICGFETSWNKHQISPWCYAFDNQTAEVLEYYDELKHYWLDGYGDPLTARVACLPIKHMFETFIKPGPTATFLFAHSGTLLKTLAFMEMYKPDSPLRGDAIKKDRTWNASHIDAFASNLAFVLYRCKDEDYVLTLHQEKVVKLPMCDQELCPLKRLKEYFAESLKNCDFDKMCNTDYSDSEDS